MTSLAATIRSAMRKLAAAEVSRAVKRIDRLERQLRGLRESLRAERRRVVRLERKLARLRLRAATTHGVPPGAEPATVMLPQAIRKLRGVLPRNQFARLVGVSPGSIFGWESGRTTPRGRSLKRLAELEKLGLPVLGVRTGGSKASRRQSKRGGRSLDKRKRPKG